MFQGEDHAAHVQPFRRQTHMNPVMSLGKVRKDAEGMCARATSIAIMLYVV